MKSYEMCPETPPSSLSSQVERLANYSLIPKLPFNPQDKESSELIAFFTKPDNPQCNNINTANRNANLKAILDLVQQQAFSGNPKPNEWASLILFLGEQHDQSNAWSSPENAVLVTEVLKQIRISCLKKYTDEKYGCRLESLFTQDFENALTLKKTIFVHVVRILKTKMRPEEWEYYPAAATSFWWILQQIKYPYLSEFVDDVLPPSLLLTDDYTKSYKILGLECIIHCINNVNKTDLLRNNWGMVIYDALHKLIHEKETDVIDKLAPTLLKILGITEENPNECSDKNTKYDETMKKILFTMEFSSDLTQKKVWIPHLTSFITKMGPATLHWVDRISSMLLDYTTCNDSELWIQILKCVEVCIQNTWLKPSSDTFAEIILRIVFNASVFTDKGHNKSDSKIVEHAIYEKVSYCFELLSKCEDFEETKLQLQEILHSSETKQLNPLFLHELSKYDLIK